MGGAAFVARGETETLLEVRPVPQTFFDRLLGRTRQAGPKWLSFGPVRVAPLPPVPALEDVAPAFKRFLEKRFLDPDGAQRVVRDYLRMGVIAAQLMAEEDEDGAQSVSLQVGFSGCAGTAETTALLCAHWFGHFWRDPASDTLRADLATCGFIPGDEVEPDSADRFFPLHGDFGYAYWVDGSDWEPAYRPHPNQTHWLEVDAAVDEQRLDLAKVLPQTYAAAIDAGLEQQCLCPFCSPDFQRTDQAPL